MKVFKDFHTDSKVYKTINKIIETMCCRLKDKNFKSIFAHDSKAVNSDHWQPSILKVYYK